MKNPETGEEKLMTPQSKWVEFSVEGFYGGNGLQINSAGTYHFAETEKALSLNDSLGFENEFGAFSVAFAEDKMIWTRQENGADIRVVLSRTEEMPLRLADQVIGLWEPLAEDREIALIFISWDHTYRITFLDGSREYGLWQAKAHRFELAMVPWDRKKESRFYLLETGSWNEMTFTSLKEDEQLLKLRRRRSFPD